MSSSDDIGLSSKVLVFGKYAGTVRFSNDDRFGIELERVPMGKDGTLEGKPCFMCRDGYGLFPVKKFVQMYSRHQQAACQIQSAFRGVRSRKKTRPMFLQKAWNTLDSDAENIALERGRKTFEVAEEALEKRRESYMSEVEMEDLDSMEIEEDYDGPHISVRTLYSFFILHTHTHTRTYTGTTKSERCHCHAQMFQGWRNASFEVRDADHSRDHENLRGSTHCTGLATT